MFLGYHLKNLLKARIHAYYMRDYLIKVPYWRKHGQFMEPEVIKNADVVVNNSSLYTEYGAKYNANSYMVGQGCDVSLFNDEDDSIPIAGGFGRYPKTPYWICWLSHGDAARY